MPHVSVKMEPRVPLADSPPPCGSLLGPDNIDYKTNPYVKPPYSYATLICMAMKETKKHKITLSSIYNWITDNFMYYRMADPSWQVGVTLYYFNKQNVKSAPQCINVPIFDEKVHITENLYDCFITFIAPPSKN
jgi:hypothetical protein